MSGAPRGARQRILLLTDSLGGLSGPSGTALRRYLASKAVRAQVTELDFFEECLPALSVLARLAYTQDSEFLPRGVGELARLAAEQPGNTVVRALVDGGVERLRALISEGAYDVVVATCAVAAAAAAEITSGSRPPVAWLAATFSAKSSWIHPNCELYFVATKEVREDLVMAGVPYSRVVVSGIPAATGEVPETRKVARRAAGIAERFTVVAGGAGYSSADVRGIAATLAAHGIQVVVVPGREGRVTRQLETLAQASELVHVARSDATCSAVYLGDVVMARAGGSVMLEGVCAGIPSVIYNPVARHEVANVDFLINAGVSLLARDDDDVVEKARYLSAHPDRLAQMTASAALVGRNQAAKTIADRLAATGR